MNEIKVTKCCNPCRNIFSRKSDLSAHFAEKENSEYSRKDMVVECRLLVLSMHYGKKKKMHFCVFKQSDVGLEIKGAFPDMIHLVLFWRGTSTE